MPQAAHVVTLCPSLTFPPNHTAHTACAATTFPTEVHQTPLPLAPADTTAQATSRVTHPQGCVIPVALAQGLHAEAACCAQHGPAAVDDLGLCEALQALRVLAQAQGVEAVVAVMGWM